MAVKFTVEEYSFARESVRRLLNNDIHAAYYLKSSQFAASIYSKIINRLFELTKEQIDEGFNPLPLYYIDTKVDFGNGVEVFRRSLFKVDPEDIHLKIRYKIIRSPRVKDAFEAGRSLFRALFNKDYKNYCIFVIFTVIRMAFMRSVYHPFYTYKHDTVFIVAPNFAKSLVLGLEGEEFFNAITTEFKSIKLEKILLEDFKTMLVKVHGLDYGIPAFVEIGTRITGLERYEEVLEEVAEYAQGEESRFDFLWPLIAEIAYNYYNTLTKLQWRLFPEGGIGTGMHSDNLISVKTIATNGYHRGPEGFIQLVKINPKTTFSVSLTTIANVKFKFQHIRTTVSIDGSNSDSHVSSLYCIDEPKHCVVNILGKGKEISIASLQK